MVRLTIAKLISYVKVDVVLNKLHRSMVIPDELKKLKWVTTNGVADHEITYKANIYLK